MTAPYYDDGVVQLWHGDCRELTAWLEADVLVTDPPHGMALRSGMGGHHGQMRIAGDGTTEARDAALELWGRPPGARLQPMESSPVIARRLAQDVLPLEAL